LFTGVHQWAVHAQIVGKCRLERGPIGANHGVNRGCTPLQANHGMVNEVACFRWASRQSGTHGGRLPPIIWLRSS